MPITLVGLNVTIKTALRLEYLTRVEGCGPLSDYMLAMTKQFCKLLNRDWCHMHDPLALASAIDPNVIQIRALCPEVREDGPVIFTEPTTGGVPTIDVAADIDVEKFDKLFLERTLGFLERRQQCK